MSYLCSNMNKVSSGLDFERLASTGPASVAESDVAALSQLLSELSAPATANPVAANLDAILSDPAVSLFVGREKDGRIVACGCLCVVNTLSGRKGHIEDIVVSGECRGRGYGRLIMEYIISVARTQGPMELFLTSRPSRIAANALYQRLGFVRKDTNCYRMEIVRN